MGRGADTIGRLEAALGGRAPVELEAGRGAAVAVVLRREPGGATSVLLIERTRREDDPWSGQMAFPGGRVDPTDSSPLDAALREAREEVGLDLGRQARLLGALDDTRAMARGQWLDLVIRPHVFELVDREAELLLRVEEVASALWAPVEAMASGELDGTFPWTLSGTGTVNLPCFHVAGRVVWGLTWRMLRSLFELLVPEG